MQPGDSTLTFRFERYDGARAERVVVFDGSGIEVSPLSPASLHLDVRLPDSRLHPGDTFTVGYALTNAGDRPARDTAVSLAFPEEAFGLEGEPRQEVSVVDREEVRGAFTLRALAAGHYRVGMNVRSSANRRGALIDVQVYDAGQAGQGRGTNTWWPAAGLLLAVAAVFVG